MNARRLLPAIATAASALSITACGALPPQAPVAQASKISSALTTIAATCGESYRLQEFNTHANLRGLDGNASSSAKTLAQISKRHPNWVYQAKTLAQIDTLSVQYLTGCSLQGAAAVLSRAPQKRS